MKPVLVLLVSVLALAATGSVAAATGQETPPPWVDQEAAENNSSVAPGHQLAGAVGAQSASVESELWNRTLSERLANATTDAERAEVIADEIEILETYVEALEGVRTNVTEAWDRGDVSEGEYRASVSGLVVRARTAELRANRTVGAAENLSVGMRAAYGINVTRVENVSAAAHELYQFEDEIARDVANETLGNESDEGEIPVIADEA